MDIDWKYWLYRSARLFLLSYGTVAVYAYGFSDRSILPSPPTSCETLPDLKFLPTSQGQTIATRYLQNPNARYTLLMSHGNAEDLGDMQREMERFRDLGLNVFAYDYRGYGKSGGSASVSNVYGDVESAYRLVS
jgi:pimeloyl-ACP methyl ester carboxylesterase